MKREHSRKEIWVSGSALPHARKSPLSGQQMRKRVMPTTISNTAFAVSNGTAVISNAAPHRKNAARRTRSESSYQQRTTQKDNPTQQLIKQAVNYLIQQLEAGKSETLTEYLGAMARFHSYSFGNILAIARQRAVTYCYTSLESMNIGGCASLETRYGRHVAVRTNLMDLVDRKQITHD
jgi:hypothetical protein